MEDHLLLLLRREDVSESGDEDDEAVQVSLDGCILTAPRGSLLSVRGSRGVCELTSCKLEPCRDSAVCVTDGAFLRLSRCSLLGSKVTDSDDLSDLPPVL